MTKDGLDQLVGEWSYEGHSVPNGPDMQGAGSQMEYDDVFEIASQKERRSTGRVKAANGTWQDSNRTIYSRKEPNA